MPDGVYCSSKTPLRVAVAPELKIEKRKFMAILVAEYCLG
jgi:hypothetical protein